MGAGQPRPGPRGGRVRRRAGLGRPRHRRQRRQHQRLRGHAGRRGERRQAHLRAWGGAGDRGSGHRRQGPAHLLLRPRLRRRPAHVRAAHAPARGLGEQRQQRRPEHRRRPHRQRGVQRRLPPAHRRLPAPRRPVGAPAPVRGPGGPPAGSRQRRQGLRQRAGPAGRLPTLRALRRAGGVRDLLPRPLLQELRGRHPRRWFRPHRLRRPAAEHRLLLTALPTTPELAVPPTGVLTALVTPFRGDEVDLDAARRLCERQLLAGVAGLVPCGTTGETPTLSPTEWAAVVSTAVDAAARHHAETGRRVPVIAGVGSNSTATTLANIRAAAELGVDAGLVVLPYYNKPNPRGLAAHVQRVCAAGLPVVLYHVPGRTGQRLPCPQLAELCATPGVVAVKEATGDVAYGLELLESLDRVADPRVHLLSGDDFTFAPLVAMGAHGVISVLSNVAPRLTVRWCDAARTGDVATLHALRQRLQPVVRWLFSDTNPVPVKAAMAAMGLCDAAVRLPLAAGSPPPAGLLDGLE
ncbi:MAG: 4-hydroxy-tetrahydrodipicolinate synthase [Deltaproteobacteria bacterium]|nr:MAG: 4-hydroxy-tetrahydrodipicolinate synthase [Deltaproteobacteria bacterium]